MGKSTLLIISCYLSYSTKYLCVINFSKPIPAPQHGGVLVTWRLHQGTQARSLEACKVLMALARAKAALVMFGLVWELNNTLPETISIFAPENRPKRPKRKLQ